MLGGRLWDTKAGRLALRRRHNLLVGRRITILRAARNQLAEIKVLATWLSNVVPKMFGIARPGIAVATMDQIALVAAHRLTERTLATPSSTRTRPSGDRSWGNALTAPRGRMPAEPWAVRTNPRAERLGVGRPHPHTTPASPETAADQSASSINFS